MSYDIILIMVPPWEPKMPPLGLAYISEYLRSYGFNPKVIDFNLRLYRAADNGKRIFWELYNINLMSPGETANMMSSVFKDDIDILVDEILSLDTDIIGFSVNMASICLAGKIATQIKKKDERKKIIFGGTGCFWEKDRELIFPEDISNIDAFVIGEGEETLGKILGEKSKRFDGIEGVIYKEEDFFKPATAYYAKDIDRLPFPKFSDFNLDEYKERLIPMLISRGCIGRCAFCIDYLMCGVYRYRSPEKILEEIKYHININKINNFVFNDLICNGNLSQLERICELIIRSGLDISWVSYAMIRKDMSIELLEKMYKSGCVFLCYGLESGCDRTLKRMNKIYDSSDAEKLIRFTHKVGIATAINIIVGFPGETESDFSETVAFIIRNRDYISEVTSVSNFAIMLPSRVGSHPQEYGIKLPILGGDLNLYIDENRVGPEERIKRVRKTIFVLSNLGIKNLIVNQPGLRKHNDNSYIALLSLPPEKTDTPSIKIATLYSYLRNKKFNPIIFDFNIKLYGSVSQDLKELWSYKNWHLWSFPFKIFNVLDLLTDKIFDLANEMISLRTNVFYFCIDRENLAFSIKIASILKKWIPSILVIFGNSIFKDTRILELIPQGVVDIFVVGQEEETLCRILENSDKIVSDTPNTIIYKNGAYQYNAEGRYEIKPKPWPELSIDFDGFNLKEYSNLQLPLSWLQKN